MIFYRGNELSAIRKGPFKVHFQTAPGYAGNRVQEKFVKHETPLLFQLENDPSENYDVAAEYPDVLADLQREVEKHKATLKPVQAQY